MKPSYTYRCKLDRVVDGDTLEADVRLGFLISIKVKLRLLGINCPEMNTPEGQVAKQYTKDFMDKAAIGDGTFTIQSVKVDKYGGRWDATVWVGGKSLNDALVESGNAVRKDYVVGGLG